MKKEKETNSNSPKDRTKQVRKELCSKTDAADIKADEDAHTQHSGSSGSSQPVVSGRFNIIHLFKKVLLVGAGAYLWPFLLHRDLFRFVTMVSKSIKNARIQQGELLKCFRFQGWGYNSHALDLVKVTSRKGESLLKLKSVEILRRIKFFLSRAPYLGSGWSQALQWIGVNFKIKYPLGSLVLNVLEDDKKGLILQVSDEQHNLKLTCKAWRCDCCTDGVSALRCCCCGDQTQCADCCMRCQSQDCPSSITCNDCVEPVFNSHLNHDDIVQVCSDCSITCVACYESILSPVYIGPGKNDFIKEDFHDAVASCTCNGEPHCADCFEGVQTACCGEWKCFDGFCDFEICDFCHEAYCPGSPHGPANCGIPGALHDSVCLWVYD